MTKPKAWTDRERAFIREHYKRTTARTLSKCLRRPLPSVYNQANALGLSKTAPRYGEELDQLIREKHAAGWSDQEIARTARVERHTIHQRRARLGLQPNANQSEHQREKVRAKTREQLEAAGLDNLAQLRAEVFRRRSEEAGWPADLRPRAVQILNALWENGPMTRRELADALGMPWKGSRKSLVSNDPEGSYLAHLLNRGLVICFPRAAQVTGQGSGRSCNLYSLPLNIERKAQ